MAPMMFSASPRWFQCSGRLLAARPPAADRRRERPSPDLLVIAVDRPCRRYCLEDALVGDRRNDAFTFMCCIPASREIWCTRFKVASSRTWPSSSSWVRPRSSLSNSGVLQSR
jgi:hypothetical protein